MAPKRPTAVPKTGEKRKASADDLPEAARRLRQKITTEVFRSRGVRKTLKPKGRKRAATPPRGGGRGPGDVVRVSSYQDALRQPRLWPIENQANGSQLTRPDKPRKEHEKMACEQGRACERSWARERARVRDGRFVGFGDAMDFKENVWMHVDTDGFFEDILDDAEPTEYGNPTGITPIGNDIVAAWDPLHSEYDALEVDRAPLPELGHAGAGLYGGASPPAEYKFASHDAYHNTAAPESAIPSQTTPPSSVSENPFGLPPVSSSAVTSPNIIRSPGSTGAGVPPPQTGLAFRRGRTPTNGLLGPASEGSGTEASGQTGADTIFGATGQPTDSAEIFFGVASTPNAGARGPFTPTSSTGVVPDLGFRSAVTHGRQIFSVLEDDDEDDDLFDAIGAATPNRLAWPSRLPPSSPGFTHGAAAAAPSATPVGSIFAQKSTARAAAAPGASPGIFHARTTPTGTVFPRSATGSAAAPPNNNNSIFAEGAVTYPDLPPIAGPDYNPFIIKYPSVTRAAAEYSDSDEESDGPGYHPDSPTAQLLRESGEAADWMSPSMRRTANKAKRDVNA